MDLCIQFLQLLAALALLIIVHEFGHYVFARIFGIRVDKFYLFFNPRFSLVRYIPSEGRLELGTWVDKEEKPHPMAKFNIGQNYQKTGNKIPAWKQTIFGIGWIPLGGYCAIAGMIDETQDSSKLATEPQPWEFRTKPAWQRLLVMCGGVIFNFLAAIIICIGIFASWGKHYVKFRDAYAGMEFVSTAIEAGFRNGDIPLMADGREIEADTPNAIMELAQAKTVTVLRNGRDTVNINLPSDFLLKLNNEKQGFFSYRKPVVVAATIDGDPAAKAGIQTNDHIIAVGDSMTPGYTELTQALASYAGRPTPITIKRNGSELKLTVTPTPEGKLGFQLKNIEDIYPTVRCNMSIAEAIPSGWNEAISTLTNYVKSMKHIFTKDGAKSLGGFKSLAQLYPEKDMCNWLSFWRITAFLSIALAFMNILPIPALDGGHVLFLLIEMITRRQLPVRILEVIQTVGIFFLLALLAFANLNDYIHF